MADTGIGASIGPLARAECYFSWTLSIALLPVVLVHELAHIVACLLLRIELWQLGYVPGLNGGPVAWWVSHEQTTGASELVISLAPLALLPLAFAFQAYLPVAAVFVFAGAAGVGDVLKLIHERGWADLEGISALDGGERVAIWTFNEPPAEHAA